MVGNCSLFPMSQMLVVSMHIDNGDLESLGSCETAACFSDVAGHEAECWRARCICDGRWTEENEVRVPSLRKSLQRCLHVDTNNSSYLFSLKCVIFFSIRETDISRYSFRRKVVKFSGRPELKSS